jgi:methylated-DNA-[protein]-cysteine S-methyltransferase
MLTLSRRLAYTTIPSPLDDLLLVGDDEGLAGLYTVEHRGGPAVGPSWVRDPAPFVEARAQLEAYFAGELEEFDLRLAPRGTPWQLRVWEALRAIPYAATASYSEIAARVCTPAAARAVGHANGRNPLSVVVPCHRVVGADGRLTGYGGGLERKRWLLDHERRALL